MTSLNENGEWAYYILHIFTILHIGRNNGHVVTLVEGEWSCYIGGHFNGRRMIMLQRWCLMEGA